MFATSVYKALKLLLIRKLLLLEQFSRDMSLRAGCLTLL